MLFDKTIGFDVNCGLIIFGNKVCQNCLERLVIRENIVSFVKSWLTTLNIIHLSPLK